MVLLQVLTDSVIRMTAWTVRPNISSPLICSVNSFSMEESSRSLATSCTTRSQMPKDEGGELNKQPMVESYLEWKIEHRNTQQHRVGAARGSYPLE